MAHDIYRDVLTASIIPPILNMCVCWQTDGRKEKKSSTSWLLHLPKQMHNFYANCPYTSIYHQQRAWHLLWICMSLWQLKAGERWEEETMIAQAGRATGHSILRRCNSSPPHHFTQLLYWFCNWNLLSPSVLLVQLPLCCIILLWLHLCVHMNHFHSTLTFQPNCCDDTHHCLNTLTICKNKQLTFSQNSEEHFKHCGRTTVCWLYSLILIGEQSWAIITCVSMKRTCQNIC